MCNCGMYCPSCGQLKPQYQYQYPYYTYYNHPIHPYPHWGWVTTSGQGGQPANAGGGMTHGTGAG